MKKLKRIIVKDYHNWRGELVKPRKEYYYKGINLYKEVKKYKNNNIELITLYNEKTKTKIAFYDNGNLAYKIFYKGNNSIHKSYSYNGEICLFERRKGDRKETFYKINTTN